MEQFILDKENLALFIKSISQSIQRLTQETPELHKLYMLPNGHIDLNDVSISVGIFGEKVDGDMVITMDRETAVKLAGKLLNRKVGFLCRDSKSALSEMTNVLSASATRQLTGKGILCDITTPHLMEGKNLKIHTKTGARTIVIPMSLSSGAFEMNLALRAVS